MILYHLVDERGLLAARLGLLFEHRISTACYKTCREQRYRGQHYDRESDERRYSEHENERHGYRDNAREQLGEAQYESVGELLRVRRYAADNVAVGVGVGERHR